MKNSESIKKLQNQVNQLENNIMKIINQLEKDDKKEKNKKKKKQKKIKEKKNKNINIDNTNINNHDISNFGDVSINVPRIIMLLKQPMLIELLEQKKKWKD